MVANWRSVQRHDCCSLTRGKQPLDIERKSRGIARDHPASMVAFRLVEPFVRLNPLVRATAPKRAIYERV
jgi:hypothetical protein